MTDSDALDTVLARAREGLSPSEQQVARVWGEISPAGISNHSPRAAAQPSASSRRWQAFGSTGGSHLAAAALLLGAGFSAGYWTHSRSLASDTPTAASTLAHDRLEAGRSPLPAPAPAAPSSDLHATAEPVGAAEVANEPPSDRPARTSLPRHAPVARGDDPAAELALLERIERALRNTDGALALALLGELEREHPRTQLAEERRAARLMANCLTEPDSAAAPARAFLQAQPASVYAKRLRALCKLE